MEPLTEHRAVAGPVVYGYLRLLGTAPRRQDALRASLLAYCQQHELQLSGIFTERDPTSAQCAAFTGLMDALAMPETYGAILPAVTHLGPHRIVHQRRRQITALGRRLLVIRPMTGKRPSHPGGWTGPAFSHTTVPDLT